jgi:hypothetical protein
MGTVGRRKELHAGGRMMTSGLVYVWTSDPTNSLGGRLTKQVQELHHLDDHQGKGRRLQGRFVSVRNAGSVNEPAEKDAVRAMALGDAEPNEEGDFIFEPGRGGGRLDKVLLAPEDMRHRYIQASHFGEVNTYYHIDKIASHIDRLLQQLGETPLPKLIAIVNAHHAAIEINGIRDGLRKGDRWLAFQGGHYRLPSKHYEIPEFQPLSKNGEVHLGPGRQLLHYGALFEVAGGRYRSNASHNAGIIYHEYGHHVTRHTADLRANRLRPDDKQSNRKSALDEGFADYLAASMMGTPHIWAWHHRHDTEYVHPRSLTSKVTMSDFDHNPGADAHHNGTIWAAALWDMREQLRSRETNGAQTADLLVLRSLTILGRLDGDPGKQKLRKICRVRESYSAALAALLEADQQLDSSLHSELILETFGKRRIRYNATENGPREKF